MTDLEHPPLLDADALAGLRIAVSASESPDLARLGLVETHFRLALGEIARSVLVGGGKLAYGGHLEPEGYTAFLSQELHRYSRRDRPMRVYLAWQEHRRFSLDDLDQQRQELGLFGDIVCLDPRGEPVDPREARGAAPEIVNDAELRGRSLTSMRQFMAKDTHARVLIGGRRSGFQGSLPGVLEEALISLKQGQPIYLVGGFGGVALDIIKALRVDDGTWIPIQEDTSRDERLLAGIAELEVIASGEGRRGLSNGLDDAENRQLAATHRPTEIAALISLGLGRRFSRK